MSEPSLREAFERGTNIAHAGVLDYMSAWIVFSAFLFVMKALPNFSPSKWVFGLSALPPFAMFLFTTPARRAFLVSVAFKIGVLANVLLSFAIEFIPTFTLGARDDW